MSDNRHALRPEAGPVPLDALNRSQREALQAIVSALSQAVTDAARSNQFRERQEADPALDTDRVSRLFFVSGQPGSGKTSLYATLRALVGTDSRYSDLRTEYRKWLPTEPFSVLDGTTRWLDPLDLEVAVDEEENLLAAVLVRISEALDHSSLYASTARREALEQLAELANDVGIAWDGNLKARAGRLDPDSYSQETIRTQGARLRINERLRSSLDTLSTGLSGAKLFVLPIDDFYLKPAASLDLLRLLRMISVPRLFFLMMGDIKTVEALFFEKALADWTAIAGPEVFATLRDRTLQEVLPRAREMKARYLRKLIPTGQRAVIAWTEWDEALKFRPLDLRGSADDRRLGDLLSRVRICWTDDPPGESDRNLFNYLVFPPPREDRDPDTTKKRFRETYSGLQILDAPPREILDLWMSLAKSLRKKTVDERVPAYLWTLVDCALLAIEEQDFLTEENQETLRFAFPTSTRDDLQLRMDELRVRQKDTAWRSNPTNDVLLRPQLDWRLGIRGRPPATNRQLVEGAPIDKWYLPPKPAAWIILLHDLAWTWKASALLGNLIGRLRAHIAFNRIEATNLDTGDPGWAWYKNDDQWSHFPLPGVETFRQMDRFLAVWSREYHDHLGPGDADAEVHRGGPTQTQPDRRPRTRNDQEWTRKVVQGWAKAAWIVQKDSELRYHSYVKLHEDATDDKRLSQYVALLRDWYEEQNEERDEFMREYLSVPHSILKSWGLGEE